MTKGTAALAALALCLAPCAAHAQQGLAPNQQIRATVTDGPNRFQTTARVLEVGRDSVWLDVKGAREVHPRSALSHVELRRGYRSHAPRTLLGALGGTVLGVAAALVDHGMTKHQETELVCGVTCVTVTRDLPYPAGRTVAFTAGGTLLGAIVGYVLTPQRWEPLPDAPAAARPLPPPPPAQR